MATAWQWVETATGGYRWENPCGIYNHIWRGPDGTYLSRVHEDRVNTVHASLDRARLSVRQRTRLLLQSALHDLNDV